MGWPSKNHRLAILNWGLPGEYWSGSVDTFLRGCSVLGLPHYIATLGKPTMTATELSNSIRLDWTTVSGATNYELYRSFTLGGPFALLDGSITDIYYVDTGLTPGEDYFYIVRGVGSLGSYSEEVEGIPITTTTTSTTSITSTTLTTTTLTTITLTTTTLTSTSTSTTSTSTISTTSTTTTTAITTTTSTTSTTSTSTTIELFQTIIARTILRISKTVY